MATNISTHIDHADDSAIASAILADLTALRASIVAITAKLDADVGVTDVDFAATCNPIALTIAA